ncbi:MAG: orotidine-5'-phosphate decarboxylase [Hyphomicrobiaceae bacterium]|nr:orotidine-5'-phosphate decarboxylase [Hyphomicrobiaceae bacterium]
MLTRASLQPRDRLCLALDVADVDTARALLDQVAAHVGIVKIGYRLGYAGGLDLINELAAAGTKVFADFKLHDIDNTVADGVASLSARGAALMTTHAYPKTMRAAVAARPEHGPVLLGVTVLTSMDDADLAEAGYAMGVSELVEKRARDAAVAGMGGLVCSAAEAESLRAILPDTMLLVTPGIRPAGAERGDQKRVMTPERAIRAGADILVIGRPILAADDPAEAARAILGEIETALAG